MKFSICIPNYNYARYLGRTLQSVLDQTCQDFEILVSDNASTDDSVEVVRSFDDPRIRLHVNNCNVGFAGNLDRAARMATGDYLLMLSSDDLMGRDALAAYARLLDALGDAAARTVISSTVDVVDADDRRIGRIGPDFELWRPEDRTDSLAQVVPGDVYSVAGEVLLKRCLATMKNPFNFLATLYPRRLYERVEGYGGSRLVNPDKWFHWKLLAAGPVARFVDTPLFSYRWHAANQSALQVATGALKYLVDEYSSVIEFDAAVLARLGLRREDLERTFIERDIARHGLASLATAGWRKAYRVWQFGRAAYPSLARRNWKMWCLAGLLAAGPLGKWIAKAAYRPSSTPITES